MFDTLTQRFAQVVKRLRGQGVLTEENVAEALKEVRLALLEADVNFQVVKNFIATLRAKAVGQEVLQSLTPGHQVVKLVWEELRDLMGHAQAGLSLSSVPPTVVMMVGLQGAGKTTTCGKLARLFKTQGKRVLLVAADPRRPAAAEQLASLGAALDVSVHRAPSVGSRPSSRVEVVRVCTAGVEQGRAQGFDVVILDTGGRLHVDDELMAELAEAKRAIDPQETLLVADAMTGQDAVAMAQQFDQRVGLTGLILTKVEGDARGGAVLSIRAVTGKPVKFLGVGEKPEALEAFHPDRMASRILGMGDVLSLIEKAQAAYEQEEAEALQQKLTTKTLTLEDFREQIRQINRLGSMEQILGMLPGGARLQEMAGGGVPEREIGRVVAIIDSMTARERRDHTMLNGSRKKRIARGSGTTVQEVNRLIKQFLAARTMVKALSGGGGRGRLAQVLRSR
jgi:signal recognition particle subunit SRP54